MTATDDVQYQETITLLHEEIARLEAELRAREDAEAEAHDAAGHAGDGAGAARDGLARHVAALTVEVSDRDETIALLVEQIRRGEEAEAAAKAEWDQLNLWVAEVERRVEGLGATPQGDHAAFEAERRQIEDDRLALQAERRTWVGQREALEQEVAHLRAALAGIAHDGTSPDHGAVAAFEREIAALRADRDGLTRAAAEAEVLRARRHELEDEARALRLQLAQVLDDRQRVRIEHEAELAAMRGARALDALRPPDCIAPEAEADPSLSIDRRIQVLRQHLLDIHEQEQRERSGRTLSSRLSRLWNRTGPR